MEQDNRDERVMSDNYQKPSHAPWYTIPKQPIASVEHPFIIKDVDKGLATLGSPRQLQEVCRLKLDMRQPLMILSWSKMMAPLPVCI